MRKRYGHIGQLAAAASLAIALLLTGCEPASGSGGEATAQFVENLRMFVADFARQALAAYLL